MSEKQNGKKSSVKRTVSAGRKPAAKENPREKAKSANPDFGSDTIMDSALSIRIRLYVISFIAFVIFAVLGLRLWEMQVYNGKTYASRAMNQSIRRIRVPAVRGRILDRHGEPIVDNRVSYNVQFHLEEMRRRKTEDTISNILQEAERIADCIHRKNELTQEVVIRHKNTKPGVPLVVFKDLKPEELGRLEELRPFVSGLEISAEPVRNYPQGGLAQQTIGYVQAEDPQNAQDRAEYFYYISDITGRSGLERLYDEKLRGSAGSELVLVNSVGFVHQVLETPAEVRNGYDIQLTLDIEAQGLAEQLLQGYTGAMVVMDAATGDVLAMVSQPSYNPADFVPYITKDKFTKLNNDPFHPFLNRAAMGSYLPGSIIKPLCGLAVLEAGISPDSEEDCTGLSAHGYGVGIHCSNRYGHGPMDLPHAIMKSCNVYFVNKGVAVGIDALSRVYASAGIGSKTGIEISEVSGILPKNGKRWNENETAYVAFGQGQVEVTPLQAARYFAAIANGGKIMRPHIVKRIYNPNYGKMICVSESHPEIQGQLAASRSSLDVIRKGMYMVVHEPGGSGVKANSSNFVVYGKTGTADIVKKGVKGKNVWFAGFASKPDSSKVYSFALVIEDGKSGGGTAAPIIRSFFDNWQPAE